MEEIFELQIDSGLSEQGKREHLTNFCNVGRFSKLRFVVVADQMLDFSIEWHSSPEHLQDSVNLLKDDFKCLSKTYRNIKMEVTMPYLRMRIMNNTAQNNNMLSMKVFGVPYFQKKSKSVVFDDSKDQNIVKPKEPHKRLSFIRRAASPQKSRMGNAIKASSSSESLPELSLEDVKRVSPGFIPRNTLLVGMGNNKLKTIPPGLIGQFLMVLEDNEIGWGFPYGFEKNGGKITHTPLRS